MRGIEGGYNAATASYKSGQGSRKTFLANFNDLD
jgi:hypothetical protein